MPLSLIGTFGVMYLAGFSINNLTLMALTIATGFVVDDAIVMIENIARYIEAGEKPLDAALKGAEQIGFTIISLTISLIAVLIPLLFMGDVVGRLFREFAITLAISILISAVVSLTLTPMMSREVPAPHRAASSRASSTARAARCSTRVIARYGSMLNWVLDRQAATLIVALITLILTVVLYIFIPKGFFPIQDTGAIQGITEAPQTHLVRGDGGAAAGAGARHPAGSRGGEPFLVHRRRRHQLDAEQRPHADQSEAARRAQRARRAGDSQPANQARRRSRASRSTCSRCRT